MPSWEPTPSWASDEQQRFCVGFEKAHAMEKRSAFMNTLSNPSITSNNTNFNAFHIPCSALSAGSGSGSSSSSATKNFIITNTTTHSVVRSDSLYSAASAPRPNNTNTTDKRQKPIQRRLSTIPLLPHDVLVRVFELASHPIVGAQSSYFVTGALVCKDWEYPALRALYRSVGFRSWSTLRRFLESVGGATVGGCMYGACGRRHPYGLMVRRMGFELDLEDRCAMIEIASIRRGNGVGVGVNGGGGGGRAGSPVQYHGWTPQGSQYHQLKEEMEMLQSLRQLQQQQQQQQQQHLHHQAMHNHHGGGGNLVSSTSSAMEFDVMTMTMTTVASRDISSPSGLITAVIEACPRLDGLVLGSAFPGSCLQPSHLTLAHGGMFGLGREALMAIAVRMKNVKEVHLRFLQSPRRSRRSGRGGTVVDIGDEDLMDEDGDFGVGVGDGDDNGVDGDELLDNENGGIGGGGDDQWGEAFWREFMSTFETLSSLSVVLCDPFWNLAWFMPRPRNAVALESSLASTSSVVSLHGSSTVISSTGTGSPKVGRMGVPLRSLDISQSGLVISRELLPYLHDLGRLRTLKLPGSGVGFDLKELSWATPGVTHLFIAATDAWRCDAPDCANASSPTTGSVARGHGYASPAISPTSSLNAAMRSQPQQLQPQQVIHPRLHQAHLMNNNNNNPGAFATPPPSPVNAVAPAAPWGSSSNDESTAAARRAQRQEESLIELASGGLLRLHALTVLSGFGGSADSGIPPPPGCGWVLGPTMSFVVRVMMARRYWLSGLSECGGMDDGADEDIGGFGDEEEDGEDEDEERRACCGLDDWIVERNRGANGRHGGDDRGWGRRERRRLDGSSLFKFDFCGIGVEVGAGGTGGGAGGGSGRGGISLQQSHTQGHHGRLGGSATFSAVPAIGSSSTSSSTAAASPIMAPRGSVYRDVSEDEVQALRGAFPGMLLEVRVTREGRRLRSAPFDAMMRGARGTGGAGRVGGGSGAGSSGMGGGSGVLGNGGNNGGNVGGSGEVSLGSSSSASGAGSGNAARLGGAGGGRSFGGVKMMRMEARPFVSISA
ncbi:hypothetical protein HDU76_005923 [Blyttiomyces sp. JEL0837]|nr:hypothetical protein HDU76_005923 [Blyttiomyces sp. JEL0837]